MKTDLDKIFNQDFDLKEPTIGHFDRFQNRISSDKKRKTNSWKWISIAASVVLIFGIWLGQNNSSQGLDLADVSPKMEETQDYFTSLIRSEIEKVNLERNEDSEKMIKDAFLRLDKLDEQYNNLTVELKSSDQDKRVIFAMISNFQQRIEVLQNLLEQIDNNKQLKATKYENYS